MKYCFLIITCLFLTACIDKPEQVNTESEQQENCDQTSQSHKYGGWYCPDNTLTFPAVDIDSLVKVPVIRDRLPTKEETWEGKSLIYIDTLLYPDAKVIDMELPRLARFDNKHTKKEELVIVIQALDIDGDSIVGFRYVNGGNGSAWLNEVNFIEEDEAKALGNTAFVSREIKMTAPKQKVWDLITKPEYAKVLGSEFGEGLYIESDWTLDAEVKFKNAEDKTLSTGFVTASWENMYIQIDYNFSGYHYVEKYLILDNEDNSVSLHLTAGPYSSDIEAQKVVWGNWLNKLKELAEQC